MWYYLDDTAGSIRIHKISFIYHESFQAQNMLPQFVK